MFPEKHNSQDEQHKKRILWISVSAIGGIIFFFWFFNIFHNIQSVLKKENLSESEQNRTILPEIKEQLNDMHSKLGEIKPVNAKNNNED